LTDIPPIDKENLEKGFAKLRIHFRTQNMPEDSMIALIVRQTHKKRPFPMLRDAESQAVKTYMTLKNQRLDKVLKQKILHGATDWND